MLFRNIFRCVSTPVNVVPLEAWHPVKEAVSEGASDGGHIAITGTI